MQVACPSKCETDGSNSGVVHENAFLDGGVPMYAFNFVGTTCPQKTAEGSEGDVFILIRGYGPQGKAGRM